MKKGEKRSGGPRTAAEVMAELESDPTYLASQKALEVARERDIEQYQAAAREVIADLAKQGIVVGAIGDLCARARPYPEAVPVLVRWLPLVQNAELRADLIRALAVPWAGSAAPLLVREFEAADDPSGTGVRWLLGSAIEAVASQDISEEMLRLSMNRQYGRAREMVVLGLRKCGGERVIDALMTLLTDEQVAGHAVMALGDLRAVKAIGSIERFLGHSKQWVRAEAKKALGKIARTEGRV